ncbi:hypothetical protein [Mesorhizobium sp. M0802]|uniref:tetratricopeptide repeat protein n=1 Tax=Mesorhizobium sp. M0802 TaxID=2957001 RepID=UPI003338FF98
MILGSVAVLSLVAIGVFANTTLARSALNAGMPSLAVAVLKPAAGFGDPKAMNDLGVLLNRGTGTEEDPAEAARLLSAAAESGLPRAQLNLALVQKSRCRIDGADTAVFAMLEKMALTGDVTAASFAAECFGRSSAAQRDFAPWGERFLKLAEVGATGDGKEKIKFAWTLIEASDDSILGTLESIAADHAVKNRLLNMAAKILLAARDEDAAAFYGLATMRDKYADRLEKGPVADEVMRRTSDQWLLEGATAGHQVSGCNVARNYMRDFMEKPGEDTRARLVAIDKIIYACLTNRTSARETIVIEQGGRKVARSFGEDFAQDRWRGDGPLLVAGPKYDDRDFDTAAHDDVVQIFNRMQARFGS